MKRVRIPFVILILCMALLTGLFISTNKVSADTAQYVILVGGTYSIDDGCPSWGTADYSRIRAIGDNVGTVVINYEDGSKSEIPLIFGYTLWFRQMWNEQGLPFKGDGADQKMSSLLKDTLCLYGGYEGLDKYILKIKAEDKKIAKVNVVDRDSKEGKPVFDDILIITKETELKYGSVSISSEDKFFDSHTVDASDPLPTEVSEALITLRDAVSTNFSEYDDVEPYEFPKNAKQTVVFSGNSLANIATGVFYENLQNLYSRFEENGMVNTSYKEAPSWWYNGFGAYNGKAGSYYGKFYSRDGGRAIMTLNHLGGNKESLKASEYGFKAMMYFPDNGLKLKDSDIPGHYTVIINEPMIYSTYLVPNANWATKYTKAKFGETYQNLGNQETDGHGLMMLAAYKSWQSASKPDEWAKANFEYIKEGVKWIEWCFEHEDLSFARKGLLYAESEAGMCSYTLYCNVPCYLGVLAYADIAASIGENETAQSWLSLAGKMKSAIEEGFLLSKNGSSVWKQSSYGFFYCPVITMLSDYYGYNLSSMDKIWTDAARNAYMTDIESLRNNGYFGAAGIGYNHSMITQAALLLDEMSDATKLVENLCRISYAPGQPEPYLVPEGVSVDLVNCTVRRQGDLGNLVQLSEALKCYSIVLGISGTDDSGCLTVMPRLPENWNVSVTDMAVENSSGTVSLSVSYPSDGLQTASISLNASETVRFRFGPFNKDTTVAACMVNGNNVPSALEYSGDSAWVWVTLNADDYNGKTVKMCAVYADSVENLRDFPDDWSVSEENAAKQKSGTVPVIIAVSAVVIAVMIFVIIFKLKHKKEN